MNHNFQITQEVQAKCPHGKEWLGYEMALNKWRTGDKICRRCGLAFHPDQEPPPVEYRTQIITTPHALLVAVKLNDDLELQFNPKPQMRDFIWALVSKSTGSVKMGVDREVAEDCVAKGLIEKVEVTPPQPETKRKRRTQWNPYESDGEGS
ncbi:MAG: hypothetical protein JXK94_04380 [Deltaproteobacteria bacterium]|nr:hypothetical protein [Deltaproteobacteria bacterium]